MKKQKDILEKMTKLNLERQSILKEFRDAFLIDYDTNLSEDGLGIVMKLFTLMELLHADNNSPLKLRLQIDNGIYQPQAQHAQHHYNANCQMNPNTLELIFKSKDKPIDELKEFLLMTLLIERINLQKTPILQFTLGGTEHEISIDKLLLFKSGV